MQTVSHRRAALDDFVTRLRQTLSGNILDVRLFGSEARGDATAQSDAAKVAPPKEGMAI